jgi:hypothetical protein
MMGAVSTPKTLVNFYETTRHNIREESHFKFIHAPEPDFRQQFFIVHFLSFGQKYALLQQNLTDFSEIRDKENATEPVHCRLLRKEF